MVQSHLSRVVPLPQHRLEFPSLQPVQAGMPELCRAGLSENWLLKACGHRHWLALASAHRLDVPDFRGSRDERLYPAFIAVMIDAQGHGLGGVRENQRIDFALHLERRGRTRFHSSINVTADGVPLATVSMESVFVHRAIPGVNRSATRSAVAHPCRLPPPAHAVAPCFRADTWRERHGFAAKARMQLATVTLDPSPHEDFNGADFLYFSAFQALLDRAEWAWFRWNQPLVATHARDIFYTGNAELGDRIIATLHGHRDAGPDQHHWIELTRHSDGQTIAVAFTQRRALSV